MKKRKVTINGEEFESVTQAARYLRIHPFVLWKWIRNKGENFESGDLTIEVE